MIEASLLEPGGQRVGEVGFERFSRRLRGKQWCNWMVDSLDLDSVLHPWLVPYLPLVQQVLRLARSQPLLEALNAARSADDHAMCFVDQSELSRGEAYEAFIARTGRIPTRSNMHDLFNGVMWLTWPKTKRRLNVLQSQAIAERGSAGPRGGLRDALTLFDENAALLEAPAVLVELLRARAWKSLFIEQRSLWQSARLVLFGHALMEKLLQPRKAITAHVWVVDAVTDAAVAASLSTERLMSKDFLPLPVLGVPGWWPANEHAAFYEDVDVFRPARRRL